MAQAHSNAQTHRHQLHRTAMAGKRKKAQRQIHPRNKYCDNPPDFSLLASLYPSFEPYVFYSGDGRPRIDWTDFNATRELTRVLLLHDHGLNWWIPDGQLCPTVTNRSNYIHWIEDLLACDVVAAHNEKGDTVKGFDIGTGANCIYPLLGASILRWNFVASDVTDVAIEWASQNVSSNQQISELIEIRRVDTTGIMCQGDEFPSTTVSGDSSTNNKNSYIGPPILLGVVKEGEKFDFCMCNPPFFESMEEACLNPKTSCGGTPEEMVCVGGELAFVSRIIEDSTKMKHTFRWFTSMVGRKVSLNVLVPQLWRSGVTVVKTTEFSQGRTSRWGIAWSFFPASIKKTRLLTTGDNNLSFMLQGLQRQHSALHVLQNAESFLINIGVSCKVDSSAFNIEVNASADQIDAFLKNCAGNTFQDDKHGQQDVLSFRITVFQQIPGTFLVKGKLLQSETYNSNLFSLVFHQMEEFLKTKFCTERIGAK